MEKLQLHLIPASLELEPKRMSLDKPLPRGGFEFRPPTEESMASIIGQFEELYFCEDKGKTIAADMFGWIYIQCLITGKTVMWPVPANAGWTVHALNNNKLIIGLDQGPELIVINIHEHHTVKTTSGERATFIERARQETFALRYTEIGFVQQIGAEPVHVFWQGEDTIDQELIDSL